ncbi:unnamed protein product [Vitrella brassicaformis CCMP3155]|uniref:Uncharacterized protein n=1 Tax=Vitrella brassicaformis (strain CCMP3155) TaxID=1169540 RepID=A0A0G4EU81_VITBC|nr:unnamed protein product [Vitrella brassicaformis CCMP3155]|eukprot:CEM01645.1 unnamed protein product [Vitrella brassicaformis CCMP3155]
MGHRSGQLLLVDESVPLQCPQRRLHLQRRAEGHHAGAAFSRDWRVVAGGCGHRTSFADGRQSPAHPIGG